MTEPFVARARAAGLQGMHFKKVWPTDDQAAELENQHRRAVGAMKGQCVVIGLKLKGSKVATAEKKALTQLTDEISQLLVNPAKERVAPAVGYLETCGFSAGECVIKLSCPDSAALVEVLRPLLSQFRWPVPIQVLRRNGSFEDDTATQQSVTI